MISRKNFDCTQFLTFQPSKPHLYATMMTKEDVKQIRESLHMTQEQFAEIMGVSPRTVSNWETGATIPKGKESHMRTLILRPQTIYGDVAMAGDVTGTHATVTNTTMSANDENLALKALLKSQEQIDRLISVIENMAIKNNQ